MRSDEGIPHYKIERAGPHFFESTIPISGNGNRDSWVIALEFHPTPDQQMIKFVDVKRLPGFAEEQGTGLARWCVWKRYLGAEYCCR